MKRVLVFLATNALWLSALMPAPIKGQAEPGKQGPAPKMATSAQSGASMASPRLTGAVAMRPQDNPKNLPPTVGGAIANYEFHNKPFNPIPGFPSSFGSYSSGIGQFHISDGYLNVLRLKEYSTFNDSWTMIIPGNFGDFVPGTTDNWTDLFFYDAVNGVSAFYATNESGELRQLGQTLTWSENWYQIVPGKFVEGDRTDLLFYGKPGGNGDGRIYKTDGTGNLLLASTWQPGPGYDLMIPGNFGVPFRQAVAEPDKWTDLLFYSRNGSRSDLWA